MRRNYRSLSTSVLALVAVMLGTMAAKSSDGVQGPLCVETYCWQLAICPTKQEMESYCQKEFDCDISEINVRCTNQECPGLGQGHVIECWHEPS
jgi:hypothetical protein